ncbi:hypothetical protein A2316_00405 [Candidatus Falkowbacteria bacterium RIFOXYB2_FULL_38_15]|uniref:Glycosyltransferase 2-like domain-containing protein n=1 Tax=Candidatus Falkowbacteria bacterium RIFOXYA2_FULL_38_12 TaxID=1797993 RepID=A0A1F5S1J0_9BACT|nr:MAG: hypothetical protein A2257_04360 [Candidatus Falkowbacteria bacterium RIFOXYA2_FULL_38_12]OGF32859.1 MAG: hypothetical protein A2316_00405 [Candidatus Falkowbacteria bacterium RIFOXYB2_FULL_38_15]OGF43995.1 MAG: hypothetical protein A2555_01135 [Candidatus Falkowbacteria bacterium RIFOXYD2_FULL_39_16]
MKITINLVAWNGKKYLPFCLDSIAKQTFRDFSLLILDNGSTDGTVEYLKSLNPLIPNTKIIFNEKNVGFAGGHNQAFKMSESDYVLMLNQDIILEPDFLEKVVDFMDKNEDAGVVTGKLLRWDFNENKKTEFLDSAGLKIFRSHRVIELGGEEKDGEKWSYPAEVFGVSGAAPIYRRKALKEVMLGDEQFFDEDFFSYKEDVDLAYRLRLFGWKAWFLPEAKAYHDRTARTNGTEDADVIKNRKNKSDFVNYHSYKNHLFFLIKNLTWPVILRSFSQIFVYELKKFGYILIFETSTLKCLVEFFKKLPKIYKKRKIILEKKKVRTKDITKWFGLEIVKKIEKKSRDVVAIRATNPLDVSIIILNYKTKGLLRECLRVIKAVSPKLNYEIIVVDNGSGDGTGKMMKEEFSETKFIASDRNLGYAAGNNLGIKEAKGRYVMIMNADIIIFPESIEKLVSYMDTHRDVGIVAPKLLNPDRTLQDSCYRLPSFWIPVFRRTPLGKIDFAKKELDKYLMKDWDHSSEREVDWLLGGCLLICKEALSGLGLLDERYFAYFDDVDLCRSMWENKWKVVYYPEVSMIHFHRRESADGKWWNGIFKKTTRIHIKSWITYFKKWGFENKVGEVQITKL